jgi:hypothetical protein
MTTATKEYPQLAARVYATTFANKPGRNRRQTPISPAVLAATGSHRHWEIGEIGVRLQFP